VALSFFAAASILPLAPPLPEQAAKPKTTVRTQAQFCTVWRLILLVDIESDLQRSRFKKAFAKVTTATT
jgi:hypothetical protein